MGKAGKGVGLHDVDGRETGFHDRRLLATNVGVRIAQPVCIKTNTAKAKRECTAESGPNWERSNHL